MTEANVQRSHFNKKEASKAAKLDISAMTNASLIRQINKILDVGISGYKDSDVLRKIAEIEANMTDIYGKAKWCKTPTECLQLEPGLTEIITNSRNYDELRDAWKGWRDVSGKMMRSMYQEMVMLMNRAIKAGGKYADMGTYYRSWYEDPEFENDVRKLFDQLAPLYDELHAYVRRKLRTHYGAKHFPSSGHIPAHLFGDMWAQSWVNIYNLLEPYPGKGSQDLTKAMIHQKYNVTHVFRVAEEFFVSIGMQPMPDSFWTKSMLVKPEGREVVCGGEAVDMFNGTDFRVRMCTVVTGDSLSTIHHEMGHVQYYIEYNHQPFLFRNIPNPGFDEGVADIVSLSFLTPEHLKLIGLIQELPRGTEGDINFLMKMALEKVAFLPFSYLVDQWRWSVFRGETSPSNYNKAWWDLRCKYQGISPPVARSEQDFDPGAKLHITDNTQYIGYFVSYVLQFQFQHALCQVMNNTRPLHRCDIYNSKIAGDRLKAVLQMGSSEHWGEAMFKMTKGTIGETRKLSAAPILAYFEPLLATMNAVNVCAWCLMYAMCISQVNATTTDVSSPATEVPSPTTEVSSTTTEVNYVTTEVPSPTTEVSSTTTEVNYVTTEVPSPTTEVQSPTTEAADTTTDVTSTTTGVTSTTAGVPSTTTGVPSTTTGVPSTTAGVTSTTTVSPGTITGVPDTFTSTAKETTTANGSTHVAVHSVCLRFLVAMWTGASIYGEAH
ncbi:angiotensin-converting enzyme-like isoform X2 [Dreissena polymorpha]|nr:angiotensin-converting enzyme-like isoform X2 [Dreissena polymorpha]